MSVFNPPHFLRHIDMPTLREFTETHVLGPYLTLDWTQDEATLSTMVSQAVEALATELPTREMTPETRKAIADTLGYWYDDLRRCHLMANSLAVEEFLLKCADDEEVLAAFADRDIREKAMWMFTSRDEAFRQTELHLSFLAKPTANTGRSTESRQPYHPASLKEVGFCLHPTDPCPRCGPFLDSRCYIQV